MSFVVSSLIFYTVVKQIVSSSCKAVFALLIFLSLTRLENQDKEQIVSEAHILFLILPVAFLFKMAISIPLISSGTRCFYDCSLFLAPTGALYVRVH